MSRTNNVLNCFVSSDSQVGTRTLKNSTKQLVSAIEGTGVNVGRIYFVTGRTDTYAGRSEGMYAENNATKTQGQEQKISTEKLFQIAKIVYMHANAEEKRA